MTHSLKKPSDVEPRLTRVCFKGRAHLVKAFKFLTWSYLSNQTQFHHSPVTVSATIGFLCTRLHYFYRTKEKSCISFRPLSRLMPNETLEFEVLPMIRNAALSPVQYSQNNAESSGAVVILTPDTT